MLTKNAVKNLINKYKAVLVNCRLLNIFGTLALAVAMPSVALAEITATVVVNQPTPWESLDDITVSSSNETVKGIHATGKTNDVTLKSAHKLIVTSEGNRVKAYGMYGNGASSKLTNAGTTTVMAEGEGVKAYGMYGLGPSNKLTNSGTMTITVKGYSTDAYGMQVTGSPAACNTLSNTGFMHVTAEGQNANAYGMKEDGATANTFTNFGTMIVTAKSTGNAHGMHGNKSQTNNFSNAGTMIVTAQGELNAHGMYGNGLNGNNFTNSGTLTVTAKDTRFAYGMYVSGTGTLNNTGAITVSGGKAYQAYVKAGTAYIGTWALKLGESYGAAETGYHVFGAGYGGTLIFGEGGKGATLIISGIGDAFVNGTEYAISDMVDIASDTSSTSSTPSTSKASGTVKGYIEKVTSSYVFLKVELVDKGRVDNSYTDQYIKGVLNVTEDNSPTQAVTTQTVSGVRNNLNQLRNIVDGQTRATGERLDFSKRNVGSEAQSVTATMYVDANTSFIDASISYVVRPVWKTFLTPYYSQYGANNGAFDGHVHGIAMGATREISNGFALGAHFGLSQGASDSALTDTNATTYTLGAHVVYSLGEALFFRGQVSGFMVENDIDMLGSSAGLTRANTDMGTVGVYAMLAAGYDIMLAPEHFLTPELGLSYFYAHMDGFDADFYDTATGIKDTSLGMASEPYGVWYADATLRWTGIFNMDKGLLKPTVRAGVRHALTSPDVSSTMLFGTTSGAKASTHSDANETAFLCEAGVAWEYDGITLSANYSGEFGDVEYSHMGMFKAEWAF